MPSDAEYAYKRLPSRLYFSKPFRRYGDGPLCRFAHIVFEEGNHQTYGMSGKDVVIRITPKGRQQIRALVNLDDRRVEELVLQHFRVEDDRPIGDSHLALNAAETGRLRKFLHLVENPAIEGDERVRIDEDDLDSYVLTDSALRQFVLRNPELITRLVETELTTAEVHALAYRKEQLRLFNELLNDENAFQEYRAEKGLRRAEDVWQQFFQQNQWILGYGLTYVFGQALTPGQLERVTSGFSVASVGKRVDALLRTRGFVSSLCFVELKRHDAALTQTNSYRSGAWSPSEELGGSIAQVQKTVHLAVEQIRSKLESFDRDGLPTGEVSYLYQPRSMVVIGSLREFGSAAGLQQERFGSFELFRRSVHQPEIITFDELYERARHIIAEKDAVMRSTSCR